MEDISMAFDESLDRPNFSKLINLAQKIAKVGKIDRTDRKTIAKLRHYFQDAMSTYLEDNQFQAIGELINLLIKKGSLAVGMIGILQDICNVVILDTGAGYRDALNSLRGHQCQILRDIFGNPFQPPPAINPVWFRWSDGAIIKIARVIYDEHGFDRLPILADALEDAGCTDAAILEHLRGPGPHVRGCWALDLLLGKE
ncbi:MAG: hypothetical protein A3F47_01340 [Candidatus Staskawiczbacteria bacterium RIFCSPHIGHO2_12_FULL_38_11]|nr:MAG: hypothetical protein A3F47_01340 [Candidatus Staskawiczbacteria bacterium RIFCSPHIGHO2_12_FULL_38_11]